MKDMNKKFIVFLVTNLTYIIIGVTFDHFKLPTYCYGAAFFALGFLYREFLGSLE